MSDLTGRLADQNIVDTLENFRGSLRDIRASGAYNHKIDTFIQMLFSLDDYYEKYDLYLDESFSDLKQRDSRFHSFMIKGIEMMRRFFTVKLPDTHKVHIFRLNQYYHNPKTSRREKRIIEAYMECY